VCESNNVMCNENNDINNDINESNINEILLLLMCNNVCVKW